MSLVNPDNVKEYYVHPDRIEVVFKKPIEPGITGQTICMKTKKFFNGACVKDYKEIYEIYQGLKK